MAGEETAQAGVNSTEREHKRAAFHLCYDGEADERHHDHQRGRQTSNGTAKAAAEASSEASSKVAEQHQTDVLVEPGRERTGDDEAPEGNLATTSPRPEMMKSAVRPEQFLTVRRLRVAPTQACGARTVLLRQQDGGMSRCRGKGSSSRNLERSGHGMPARLC